MNLFLHPWFLILLPIVLGLAWWSSSKRRTEAIRFSSAAGQWSVRRTIRQRLGWLPTACSIVSLILMIVCLARPRDGKDKTVVDSEGIAIEIVVDRSSSMRALDFQIDNERVDRLAAIKNVASQFILGEESGTWQSDELDTDELGGRSNDRIGLISFAGFADAVSPPTLDHRFLVTQLNRTQIANRRQEDGTAIGDAISLAVASLNSLRSKSKEEIKSKVVILLTDGENTAGDIEPIDAAELAKSLGVKIYTIGVGTKGQAPVPVQRTRDGRVLVDMVDVNIDEETLTKIANLTGGRYFRATDTNSLEEIYAEINKLERTEFQVNQYIDYRELAVQPFRYGGIEWPPLLFMALLVLFARLLLTQTVFRRLT